MLIHFFCSTCGKPLEADPALISQEVRCRSCGGATRVPVPRPAQQASPATPASPVATSPVPGAAAQNPTASPTLAVTPAPNKSDDGDYELVDDDLPASHGSPAARPAPQGVPVGKMIQPAGVPQDQAAPAARGLPVGKVVGPTASAPTTATAVPAATAKQPAPEVAKHSPPEGAGAKSSAQTPIVGKPIGKPNPSNAARRTVPSGAIVPSKATAPSATTVPIEPSVPSQLPAPTELPGSAESTIDDLAAATLPDPGDLVEWDQSRASAPRCERCLTVLSRDSTVCPSCGYDASVPPPVLEELPADLAIPIVRKGRKSSRASGGPVPLGLYAACAAQLLVLVAVVLQLLGTLSGEPLSVEAPSTLALAAAGFAGAGFLCTTVASVLTLLAPKQSRTQGTIYFKSGCDVVALALVVGFLWQQAPWLVLLPASALEVAAVLLILLFMKNLAAHLGDQALSARAQRLLWKTAALAGGVGLVYGFSALVGSDTFLAMRIVGILVWAYLLFHFTLIVQELAPAAAAKQIPPGEK